MNERRLGALGGDGAQKLVGRFRIRRDTVERHVEIAQTGGFGDGFLFLDLGAGFGGFPQVDDRDESHLLDLGHRHIGLDCPGACDGRFETGEIGDAGHRFPGHLLGLS